MLSFCLMLTIYIACMAVAGLAVMVRMIQYIRVNLNAEAFTHQIKKLVAAQNTERAIKLCNAAPLATIAKITRALLEQKQKGASAEELRQSRETHLKAATIESAKGAMLTNLAFVLCLVALATPSRETGIALVPSLIGPLAISAVAGLLVLGFRGMSKRMSRATESLLSVLS